jgi:hypothetical protein
MGQFFYQTHHILERHLKVLYAGKRWSKKAFKIDILRTGDKIGLQ